MTIHEFESYLQKGLGRAILFLREEPDKTPFWEAVWNHAIHDPCYDRQCNSPRGSYIKDLFDCFSDGDAKMSELLRVYGEGKCNSDDRRYYIKNLEELMSCEVEGVSAALDSLYSVLFEELLTLPNPLTNGIDSERDDYCYAASKRHRFNRDILTDLVRDGITLLQKSDRYDIVDFKDFFKVESRAEGVESILAELEKDDPSIKTIRKSYIEQTQKKIASSEKTKIPKPTNWKESIDYAIQQGQPILAVKEHLWKNLSEDDKAEIARLVEEETDPNRRFVLLRQLCRYDFEEFLRNYPRDPSPLIAELENNTDVTFPISSDNRVLWALSMTVAKIRHPSVREFALRSVKKHIENEDSIAYHFLMEAWMTNYLPEDGPELEEFVKSITDIHLLHGIAMDIIKNDLVPESVFLYLYENTPCSSCRTSLFSHIMMRYGDFSNLPEHINFIRNEARLDCDYETRMLSKASSIGKGKKYGIDIFADNIHFLGNTEEERAYDICLHGKVTMRVNGDLLADDTECCVTASALRFLRSLTSDHKIGEEEFLFPCCGNMLVPSDDGKTVTIVGCPNGNDLAIYHNAKQVKITDGRTFESTVSLDDYRTAVLAYANQIIRFLQSSPARQFKTESEKNGYEAFLNEFTDLMKKSEEISYTWYC